MKFWKEAGAEIYFQECENKIKKYKQEMEETITKLEIEREKLRIKQDIELNDKIRQDEIYKQIYEYNISLIDIDI